MINKHNIEYLLNVYKIMLETLLASLAENLLTPIFGILKNWK